MNRTIAVVLLTLCVAPCACSEATHINTTPPGGMVRVNGRELGRAPVTFKVRSWSARRNAYRYHIEMPGYLPKEGYLQPHLSPSRIVSAALSWCLTCSFHGFYEFDEDTEIVLQPAYPAPQPPDDPAAIQMRRLQDLYNQGLITADELARYRQEVIRGSVVAPQDAKNPAAPVSLPAVIRELLGPIFDDRGTE